LRRTFLNDANGFEPHSDELDARLTPALDPTRLIALDVTGRVLDSQLVDSEVDDTPDELVFQSDLRAGETSSGLDMRTNGGSRLVITDWYMTDNDHHYTGEGADSYSVGQSRACGGWGFCARHRIASGRSWPGQRRN